MNQTVASTAQRRTMNRTAHLLCAWCGPLSALLCLVGFIPLARFFPPPPATITAAALVQRYQENLIGIRLGMVLCTIGFAMLVPWGCSIAARTRGSEGTQPVLSYVQIGMSAVGGTIGVLFGLFIGVAAFRPGQISDEIVLTMHDVAWFLLLFTWAPFSLWCITIAAAILLDHDPVPAFPRWAAYLNGWVALLYVPAAGILFFKSGVLAYDGLLAFYITFVVFFVWILVMSTLTIKAIDREASAGTAATF